MTHDNVTTVGAIGAVTSPVWLPVLHEISTVAAELAPILGAIWLLTQIVTKILQYNKEKDV